VAEIDHGKEQSKDPVLDKAIKQGASDLASQELLKATITEQEAYRGAVKSQVDAESNWNHALPKGQKSLSADDIKEQLKNSKLDPQTKGFLHFIQDNFLDIAGTAGQKGSTDNSKVSINDVVAIGAMNEISPEKIDDGVKFLQENFFKLSGFDNKLTAERVEKMQFDHAFLLYPRETQVRIEELGPVLKSVDQCPQNYYQNNRIKLGVSEDDVKKLNAGELTDNLRIQALEKGMFGGAELKFDAKVMNPKAQSQYDEAAKRYAELKSKGLEKFLSNLQK
jgi:hypothetical protein